MENSIVASGFGYAFKAHATRSSSRSGEHTSISNPQITYILAHTVRGKLSEEAAKADRDLRRLVCHANLLDHLYVELNNARSQLDEELYDEEAVDEEWCVDSDQAGYVEADDISDSCSEDSNDSYESHESHELANSISGCKSDIYLWQFSTGFCCRKCVTAELNSRKVEVHYI